MFDRTYFQKLYPKGATIDGDFNAKEHARYLKSLFDLVEVDIHKVCDFGVGKGSLLKEVVKTFKPDHIEACDISEYALEELKKQAWTKAIKLKHTEIAGYKSKHIFDLGLCNSVLQYVETDKVESSLLQMAKSCRYLYFYCPTAEDYQILAKVLNFEDPYAIARPLKFYEKYTRRYFTVVGFGVLESIVHKNYKSPFLDSFYRL